MCFTCFLNTTIYELGISFAFTDERMGAASLWMVPTLSTGDADTRSGNSERLRADLIVADKLPLALLQRKQDDEDKSGDGVKQC